jgi:hypothetical protein
LTGAATGVGDAVARNGRSDAAATKLKKRIVTSEGRDG